HFQYYVNCTRQLLAVAAHLGIGRSVLRQDKQNSRRQIMKMNRIGLTKALHGQLADDIGSRIGYEPFVTASEFPLQARHPRQLDVYDDKMLMLDVPPEPLHSAAQIQLGISV